MPLVLVLGAGVLLALSGSGLTLWKYLLGAPVTEIAIGLAMIVFGLISAIIGLGTIYMAGAFQWLYDFGSSHKTRQILEEVCGKPIDEAMLNT